MNPKVAAGLFWAAGAAYLGALVWLDRGSATADALRRSAAVMPLLCGLAFASWIVRYLRWHWLLARSGYCCQFLHGLLAYLSGFAYTLTPGKVGELVRIRYLRPMGIPPHVVVAAFVWERALDLLVVLALSLLALHGDALAPAAAFVAIVLVTLGACVRYPMPLERLQARCARGGWHRLARGLGALRQGVAHVTQWLTWRTVLAGFGMGLLAWSLISLAFIMLLAHLGIVLPWSDALSAYPLAMLAGAASMLPGGIGSTEAVLVVILMRHDVALPLAAVAAVAIRLATLWLATIFGFLAMLALGRWGTGSSGAATDHCPPPPP